MITNNKTELNLENLKSFYKEIGLDKIVQIAKGENVKVAILDSGVDYFHPELHNRVKKVYDAFYNKEGSALDQLGHGTMIAGLIAGRMTGITQNVDLFIAKVTDDYGNLSDESIANGLMWSLNNGADIICMAFSGASMDIRVSELLVEAESRGVILVASVGNDPAMVGYPARHGSVLAVSSIDYALQKANFAPTGPSIDLVLPGVEIPALFSYGRYYYSTGSSPSTAIATGIIAALQFLRRKELGISFNLQQLKLWLYNNSIDLGEVGFDESYGIGVPSFHKVRESGYKITF